MLILEDITDQNKNTGNDESEENILVLHTVKNKSNNKNGKFSRQNVTILTSTDTERQTVGETAIKMTTETTIRLKEIPASMGNIINVGKEATGMLIVG